MENTASKILVSLGWFVAGILIALILSNRAPKQPVLAACSEKVDTLSVIDSNVVKTPEIVVEIPGPTRYITIYKTDFDSTAIRQRDSLLRELGIAIRTNDSLELCLTRVRKLYSDKDSDEEGPSYKAWVSGIAPSLDSLVIYKNIEYITQTKEITYKPKFTFGLQGGLGVVMPFGGQMNFGGYIGIGGQFNF